MGERVTDKRERLTDKGVGALPAPTKGYRITYDAADRQGRNWIPGFGCRVMSSGVRAFTLSYRNKAGRSGRITIGSPPAWTVEAARKEAAELKFRIDRGEDPLAELRKLRRAETVNELCDIFLADHAAGKRSERDYKSIIAELRKAIGTSKVAAVTDRDILKLHREISKRAPYRANRVLAIASVMFNFAVRHKMRPDNPCKGVERNLEEPRQRYLSPAEHSRLMATLAAHRHQYIADIFRLTLYTGCRIGEAVHATFSQFDESFATWTKPASTTKQKKTHSVPLSTPAQQLLERIHRAANGRPTVFPIVNGSWLRRQWGEVCEAAQISGLRIHDLRHSYASTLANQKVPLQVVGQLLGHAKISTTERYSHLYQDTLRQATELAGKALAGKLTVVRGGRR